MSKKRMTRRVFAVVFALLFMITGVTIPTLTPQAATEMDLSSYITMSGKTEGCKRQWRKQRDYDLRAYTELASGYG